MNSFYLELVFNASSQVYPQKTMALFTNFLPDKIELDGSWEVALVEVSYPGICYNVEGGLMTFHYDEKFKHVFAIPPAVFNSRDEFVKSLTDIPKKNTTSQKLRSSIFHQHRQKNSKTNFLQ